MSEWKPIETAPKDGTETLGYDAAEQKIFVMHYSKCSWARDGDDYDLIVSPTHWMPLPDPPREYQVMEVE